MKDWACAAGADKAAMAATAAAKSFEVMSGFLPENLPGKWTRRSQCQPMTSANRPVVGAVRHHASKVGLGNLLPCLPDPASMHRDQEVPDEVRPGGENMAA